MPTWNADADALVDLNAPTHASFAYADIFKKLLGAIIKVHAIKLDYKKITDELKATGNANMSNVTASSLENRMRKIKGLKDGPPTPSGKKTGTGNGTGNGTSDPASPRKSTTTTRPGAGKKGIARPVKKPTRKPVNELVTESENDDEEETKPPTPKKDDGVSVKREHDDDENSLTLQPRKKSKQPTVESGEDDGAA